MISRSLAVPPIRGSRSSTEARIEQVARLASGYIYYVSLRGVTGASTNGAATSALRPRDGDYTSPARETVPVGFGLKQPINFNLSAAWRM